VPSEADACVYTGDYSLDKIYLIIYVDNGLILASSKEALNVILNHLKSGIRITIDDAKEYIGIEIIRDIKAKTIFIHQASYVKHVLHKFNMVDSKTKSISADLGMNLFAVNECDLSMNNVPYRQALGCLMFLSNVTHTDIAFIVNYLSRFVTCFNKQHWCAVRWAKVSTRRTGCTCLQFSRVFLTMWSHWRLTSFMKSSYILKRDEEMKM